MSLGKDSHGEWRHFFLFIYSTSPQQGTFPHHQYRDNCWHLIVPGRSNSERRSRESVFLIIFPLNSRGMCFPLLGQGLIPFPLAPVSSTQVPSLLCEFHPEKPLPSPGHRASCWHAPSRRMRESHQMDNSRGAQQHFSLIGCGHSLPALGPPGMHPASHAAPAPAWRARLRTCRSLLRMLLVPWRMHAVSKVEPWVSRAMQRQRHESLGAVGQMCLGHSGLNPLLCARSPQPALRASMVGKFLPGCTCPVPVCPLPCGTQGPMSAGANGPCS